MNALREVLEKLLDRTSHVALRRERWLWASLFGLSLVIALGLLAERTRSRAELSAVERSLLDVALQRDAGAGADTSPVTVVLVDDRTLAEMKLRWPLPRKAWADLVRTVSSYDPAALVLSAWFEGPEDSVSRNLVDEATERLRHAGLASDANGAAVVATLDLLATEFDGDRQMSQAIAEAGNVVLGFTCQESASKSGTEILARVKRHPAGSNQSVRFECRGPSGNFPALAGASAGQGTLELLRDPDERSRRYPYLAGWQGSRVPSLALEAVRIGRPDAHDAVLQRVAGIDGAAPILRAVPPGTFTVLSLVDIMKAGPGHEGLARALQGRIVMVGVSAQGTEDFELSSLDQPTPGTFMHANAVIDLLQDRTVQTGGPAALWGLLCGGLLLLAMYFGTVGIQRLPVQVAIAVVAVGLWSGLASWRLSSGDAIPLTPVWFGIGGWLVLHLAMAGRRVNRSRNAYRAAKQRMEGELAVGREIQDSLLPPVHAVLEACPRLDAHAVVRPAREVGGDLYDIFALEDGRVCLSVGDVSDKGVPAALFMAVTTTLIRSMARLDPSPASIAQRVNDELSRNNDGSMFVTLFLAVLDMDAGTLTYTSAGHNPPYLRRDGEWIALRQRHGPVIGAMDGLDYGETEIAMAAGNLLVAYTDGVTEATDPDQALYGEDRLEAVLAKIPAPGDADGRDGDGPDTDDADGAVADGADAGCASAVVARILEDVERFESGAPQADDVTVLALRYSATAGSS